MESTSTSHSNFLTNPWWAMGQPVEGHCGTCINETATRARAGLLNILSGTTIFIMLAAPELDPIRFVAPFVIFDMVAGATFGLTPLSPAGIFGTVITRKIRPVWKPIKPKRARIQFQESEASIQCVVEYLHLDRTLSINFEPEFPHKILSWTEKQGQNIVVEGKVLVELKAVTTDDGKVRGRLVLSAEAGGQS